MLFTHSLPLLVVLCWMDISGNIDLELPDFMSTWVIARSSPCSTTCGLGLRTQELCPPPGAQANGSSCWLRQVECLDRWQCGLQTLTASAGQHLELDCLEEVMEVMGRFAFLVSWRFARGVVTTDNSIFVRYDAPGLDRVVLDPVREEDAGTYRCDVQDTSYRRVKRTYKAVKVLSPRVLSLDFSESLSQWEKPAVLWPNVTLVTGKLYPTDTVRKMVLVSVFVSAAIAAVIFLGFLTFSCWKKSQKNPNSHLGEL